MAITFDRIPANIRTPGVYTEIDPSQADTQTGLLSMRYLLFGQMLTGGAGVTPGTATLLEKVRVTSVAQARTLFGRLTGLLPAAVTLKLARKSIRDYSESAGHDLSYQLTWQS